MNRFGTVRVVHNDDPHHDVEDAPYMQFRLTYDGLLYSTANDSRLKRDKRADHKHDLRMACHQSIC
jgi:hypothetical protein